MLPTLVVITGPTAVGKTKLCVELAQYFNCDIISADSRQFFKELSIGTAKPTIDEMQDVNHHFVNSHSILDNYNVTDFEQDVLHLLPTLFKQNPLVILTGGSGLYIDAICNGFDDNLPESNNKIRAELATLYHKYGIEVLQTKLKQLDPNFYHEIDLSNVNRLYRAIEVCILTGKPCSDLGQGIKQVRPFNIIKIGLNREREDLFGRINLRVDNMLNTGLLEEVKNVIDHKDKNALKTVGYRELFDYLEGTCSLDHAIEKIKVNSRRYAKRQLVWFNRDNDYHWFHPNEKELIIKYIEHQLIA